MNEEFALIKQIIIIIAILCLCIASGYGGYKYESTKYDKFVSEVKIAGDKQAAESLTKDKEYKDNAQQAQDNSTNAINGINDWYNKHPPVGVQHDGSCSSTVPQTNSNTEGINEADTQGYTGWYLSPYSPEETEQIGSQLQGLLDLLHKDGVQIK